MKPRELENKRNNSAIVDFEKRGRFLRAKLNFNMEALKKAFVTETSEEILDVHVTETIKEVYSTMNKKIAIVGVGNCGSQVALLAEKKYPDLFDTVYVNTSESDLSMVTSESSLKFKIGNKDDIEGSGKNRTKMKEYLKKDIFEILENEDLSNTISRKKYCFIVASAAGGTGSGAAPMLMEFMRTMFPETHFILIVVLPQLGASLMEQGNSLELLQELYDLLGEQTTYMIYDNETTSNLPPTQALDVVNENIVEDLRVLSGVDNFPTPYESIDEADLESIITTPGRLLVVRVVKDLTEKNMEDSNLDEMIVKSIKKSCHSETDRNKKVVRWGIITYFTPEVNSLYNAGMGGLINFLGTPVERFNHNAINNKNEKLNFLYVIASGLSPINDRVQKITERVEELKAALAADETKKYLLSGEGSSYNIMEERKKAEMAAKKSTEIDPDLIFKKFMKE